MIVGRVALKIISEKFVQNFGDKVHKNPFRLILKSERDSTKKEVEK
jgi:hypothetical protein